MLDDSLFAGVALHKRDVDVGGKTIELWFKELPAVDFIHFHALTSSDDQDARAGAAE